MPTYEAVIGLETHAELLTHSKMFCTCQVVDSTTAEPNRYICAVCTAQPGALPVINQQAIEYAMMVGLALNCQINAFNMFARKSYFYPDLPKGYQITQYEYPIATNGWLEVETPDGSQRIGIRRAHIEEDTGKSFHAGKHSLIDLNRAGVPLLEIVTEPDFRSVEAVEDYARRLRAILVYLGVNHGDMSKGVLRFEANISVREVGAPLSESRTEVKNLNSIRSLVRATAYEIERQIGIVSQGGRVQQQTMGFNESTGSTYAQRSKEHAHDYRYFPEPDLPPLIVPQDWVEQVRARLPELPDAKRQRLIEAFDIPAQDAANLVSDKAIADYFEAGIAAGGDARKLANWITGPLFRYMKEQEDAEISSLKVSPSALVGLIKLVDDGSINSSTAKDVLDEMLATGAEAAAVVQEKGLAQISDVDTLTQLVDRILAENSDNVQRYLGGKEGLFGFFVGQVMKETKGKANTALVNDMLRERLEALRSQPS